MKIATIQWKMQQSNDAKMEKSRGLSRALSKYSLLVL